MERNELKKRFLSLPPETERAYEVQLVNIAMSDHTSEFAQLLREMLDDKGEEDPVRFAAFCALCEIRRRQKDYSHELRLLQEGEEQFADHPFYSHIKLLYYVDNFKYEDHEEILTLARRNTDRLPLNAGVWHAFADLTATAFETADFSGVEPPAAHWLSDALMAVDWALRLDPSYAKFHCTKGRLLALQGDFDQASALIREAVDLEDSHKSDYAIRINGYLNHLQQVQSKTQNRHMENKLSQYMEQQMEQYAQQIGVQQAELRQQTDRVMEELQDSMSKNLEFIGLFAGIISFTIGSISIAGSLAESSFAAAAGLIIVLMGALLCVFAGFGVVLHGFEKRKWIRNALVFLLGLGAAGIGLLICCRIPL